MIHRYTPRTTRLALVVFAASGMTALGCSLIVDFEESRIPADDVGVVTETGVVDTGSFDTGTPPDTTIEDTGTAETSGDTGTAETSGDTGTPDMGSDTGSPDTGTPDTGTLDTGTLDTGTLDTGTLDTGAPDTGALDTGALDTGALDTGALDTGPLDTGPLDTGALDTGALDTGADVAADTSVADAEDAAGDTAEAGPSTMSFSTQLTPSQENPASTSTASGTAACTFTIATKGLTCTVTHTLADATAAHIHDGPVGINGPVAHDLGTPASPIAVNVTLTDAQVGKLENGNLYLNVHNVAFPGGAIRGQLLKPGETLYHASMSAAPSITTSGKGGFGMIRRTTGAYDYAGEIKDLNAATTAAHIHKRSDSSVVAPLTTPTTTAMSTTFAGSLASTALDTTLLDGMGYYVNVHTDPAGGGTAAGEVEGTLNKIFTAP